MPLPALPSLLPLLVWGALLGVFAIVTAAETALQRGVRGKLRMPAGPKAGRLQALLEEAEKPLAALAAIRAISALGLFWLVSAEVQHAIAADLVAFAICAGVLALTNACAQRLASARPEPTLWHLLPVIGLIAAVARPLAAVASGGARAMLRLLGIAAAPGQMPSSVRDDIAGAITLGHSGGGVEKEARDRLLGALDLSDRTVDEIMRHRRQIEMINADDAPGAIISQMLASPHTRLPVYRHDEDNIVGVVHTKDLLREVDRLRRGGNAGGPEALAGLDIVKIAMKPYFIPETTALDEQMRAFLARRTHFALVVDEYGSLQGLITLEDILEEIVGDITDEFDVVGRNSGPQQSESGDFLIDGAMTIRDLNRAMDWHLPDDVANTIAGLVIHEAQMIPAEGQVFSFHGFRFEVVQRRENRLTRLNLRPL